ncbi:MULTISPECIES: DUF4148 domain-containing protein [unclassified Cupriavidus]|uniref:DUF4148 domain-containing protein n=1 Tax=Cupriavidus sp. H19C3 TaxID=3241603 RepID=UPI003BF79E53
MADRSHAVRPTDAMIPSTRLTPVPRVAFAAAIAILAMTPVARAADASAPAGLTREEVRKDLEAWERAGLRDKYRGDGGPAFFDPDVQRRLAEYQRLRAGESVPPSSPSPSPVR